MFRAALATLVTLALPGPHWTEGVAAALLTTSRESRCVRAVALRDFVPEEQSIGTQLFTAPLLRGYGVKSFRYVVADAMGSLWNLADVDEETLWRNTEAQLSGDVTLVR